MTHGIEIYNNDGRLIIGAEQPTFLIRGAGTTNFAGTAGTGYAPGGGPGDGSDGYIPQSGVSYFGNVLGSDILFVKPSGSYTSTAEVHLEGTISFGAIVQRVQRRHGRNEASQGATPAPKPAAFDWFQVAGANVNGFPVPLSSTTDYGLEVLKNGTPVFTTTQLSSFGTIQGIVETSGNSNYTTGGETFVGARTATFIAPVGANIFDYYVMFNNFQYTDAGGGNHYGVKAVYRQSTRSIVLISTSVSRKFIIAKLNGV